MENKILLSPVEEKLYSKRIASWEVRPKFHIGLIVPTGEENLAESTLQSLEAQRYPYFEFSVLSDANLASRENVWKKLNEILRESDAEWVGVIRPGDIIPTHAFLFMSEAIHDHPDWRFVYSDEDSVDAAGNFASSHFKPDFNLDLLRSNPSYVVGLFLARRDLFLTSEGFDPAGLAFRAYEMGGEKCIGHVPEILIHRAAHIESRGNEIEAHLSRSGIQARVESGLLPGTFRVRYLHDSRPPVSILIPVKEPFHLLQTCLESIVEKTSYQNYRILLSDMGCNSDEIKAYLSSLSNLGSEKIKVLPPSSGMKELLDHGLQYSGDHILLLDSHAAVLQRDWLDVMMEHAQRTEVGAVGPRLLDAQGNIYSAGIVPCSSPPFRGTPMNEAGYFGKLQVDQDYSAVSGKCLLVKKKFLQEWLAGDEKCLDTLFDVDLCLSIRSKGHLVLWTPHANLLYANSEPELGTQKEEQQLLWKKWLPIIANDPAYNRNLSLWQCCETEKYPELYRNPLPWRPLPRVLGVIGDSTGGSGEYRAKAPLRVLTNAGKIEGMECHVHHTPVGMERIKADVVLLQYQIEERHIRATELNRKYSDAFYVFEIDDLITNLSSRNANKSLFPPDTVKRLRKIASLVDRMIVSTRPLADAYKGYCRDIRVVPNYIEEGKWGHFKPERRAGKLPRVGWAGSNSHGGDLAFMVDVVKALSGEVEWVFFGMCPEELKSLVEYHEPVAIEKYPEKLAGLNFDLAVAPLEIHPFNEAKSHLKLLEYGILGYPVVCTDIAPYQGDYPVIRLKNRFQDWVKAIRAHVSDLDECEKRGDALRSHIFRHWILEKNLDVWTDAWLP